MRFLARGALALAALLVAFVGVTWLALESGGVAIVETRAADGSARETHVWYVEREGALWLEAGAPENGWFVDVQSNARVRIHIDGTVREARAQIEPAESGRVRALLHEKYGWRDAWVGLFVDASRSVAVRLREP